MAHIWEQKYQEDKIPKRKLKNKEIEYLKQLQKEINTQVISGQQKPYYFVIEDYEKVYGKELNNPDGIAVFCQKYDYENIYEGENKTYQELFDIIKKFYEENDYEYTEDDSIFSEYDLAECFNNEIEILQYQKIPKYSNMFLTQEAAQNHLKANHYHYSPEAHTYCQSIWRSEEIRLFQLLSEIDFDALKE